MKLFIPALASVFLLTACADNPKVVMAATDLQLVCGDAMALAPLAGPIAPYIIAGCGTASGLAKLAADPTSTAWVQNLIAQVKQLRAVSTSTTP